MSRCEARLKRHVLAAEQDAARRRQLEPGDHAQRRRLAAARRPEQAEELAVANGEGRVLHGDEIAEGLLQVLDADLGHRLTPETSMTTVNIAMPASVVTKDQL